MKQPRSDSKLKTLPEEEQEKIWQWFQRDGEREPMRLEDAQSEIPLRYGFTVSLGSLSEWRAWYALRRRMDAARSRAEQARVEWLLDNPDATPEALERVAQSVFTAEALEAGDIKNFVALAQLRIRARALDLDAEKLELMRRKADAADQAKEVLGSGMTMEEQNRRLREILK